MTEPVLTPEEASMLLEMQKTGRWPVERSTAGCGYESVRVKLHEMARVASFTLDDVAAIREVAEYVGHIVKRPRLERIADKIQALLKK